MNFCGGGSPHCDTSASSAGTRFVDADQVDRIFTTYVTTTLSWDQAANLPGPR